LPSGTSRPGFGVRDARIPFTAPAFRANAAIERLAAPPAGDAASRASMSAAPLSTTTIRAVRTVTSSVENEWSPQVPAQTPSGAQSGDFGTVSARSCR
jgi:hypothetical protein